jgi:hypothetical protein
MEEHTTFINRHWIAIVAVTLVALSLVMYGVHYLLFGDLHHIAIFFVGDLAFIPIEVLVVTLVIEQVLEARERRAKREKLTMLIGAFFSTLGTPLLRMLSAHDPGLSAIRRELVVHDSWSRSDFERVRECLRNHECVISDTGIDLHELQHLLVSQEEFLLRILENPMILEHESFTACIQAIFHLTEELRARPEKGALPATDVLHIAGDIRRVYSHLVIEWIDYMEYQKDHYPYLFSLAMRRNPFDDKADVIVRK